MPWVLNSTWWEDRRSLLSFSGVRVQSFGAGVQSLGGWGLGFGLFLFVPNCL